jgi:hypothetical protein
MHRKNGGVIFILNRDGTLASTGHLLPPTVSEASKEGAPTIKTPRIPEYPYSHYFSIVMDPRERFSYR